MKYILVIFAVFISGCATMLEPVKTISGEVKYKIVSSDKTMWGVPAGTVISDDKQTVFTVHKDIGIDNFLFGAFYTHLQVKSAAEDDIKNLKPYAEIDVKSAFNESISKRGLFSNDSTAVTLMPYNWINIYKDGKARLITMADVEYYNSSKEKTFIRVMSVSGVNLPLGGDNGWIKKDSNLIASETRNNVENIINYLNGSFNGTIVPNKNNIRNLKNVVYPAIAESLAKGNYYVIYEDDKRYYLFYSGGKLAIFSGVAIYDKADVLKEE